MSIEAKEEFRPKIVAFCCNWCSYAGADLAGSSRLGTAVVGEVVAAENGLIRRNPLFYHAVLCVRIGGESHV